MSFLVINLLFRLPDDFDKPEFSTVTIQRDMFYGYDTLMENVSDSSHIDFAHHKVNKSRPINLYQNYILFLKTKYQKEVGNKLCRLQGEEIELNRCHLRWIQLAIGDFQEKMKGTQKSVPSLLHRAIILTSKLFDSNLYP